jgi:hypothetical protein
VRRGIPAAPPTSFAKRRESHEAKRPSPITLTAALLCSVVVVSAQDPPLNTVLDRAAAYITEFQQQLSGIVAEETYVQEVKHSYLAAFVGLGGFADS